MAHSQRSTTPRTPIRLVLSDVDGTLVTPAKELTARTVDAVARLREAGIAFAVTSGRPPRGMAMLVEPLALSTPIAAFNGGLYVDERMRTLGQRTIPDEAVGPVLDLLQARGLDIWIYRGADWLLRDPQAPHVDREAATVRFAPTVVRTTRRPCGRRSGASGLAKIVGVSDDLELVARVSDETRELVGHRASAARSQPYYLDVTHPDANKGAVVDYLSDALGVAATEVCTLGDMPNDVLMFARSGLSIAMGNADREVQRAARHVTRSNAEEGFAHAIERYVLPARAGTSRAPTPAVTHSTGRRHPTDRRSTMSATISTDLDQLSVNTIRCLCMDMVQRANSGHPGTPMGIAPVAYTLWNQRAALRPDRSGVAQP